MTHAILPAAFSVRGGKVALIVVATGHHTFISRTLATVEDSVPPRNQILHINPPLDNSGEYLGALHSIEVTVGILVIVAASII